MSREAGLQPVWAVVVMLLMQVPPCWGQPGRVYKRDRCPFEVTELTIDQLNTPERGGGVDSRRLPICAVDALYAKDRAVRTVGLSLLFPADNEFVKTLGGLPNLGAAEAEGGDRLVRELVRWIGGALSSPHGDYRGAGARTLGLLGHPAAVPLLAIHIADPNLDVRRTVIDALREIHDPSTLEPLAQAMRDEQDGIAAEAIDGVAAVGGPDAVKALILFVQDRRVENSLREFAAFALRRLKDPKGVKVADWYLSTRGVQWQRAFYVTPLLYLLGFFGSRREAAGERGAWRKRTYAAAAVTMFSVVGLYLFPVGLGADVYWATVVLYPLGVGAGAVLLAGLIRWRGAGAVAEEFVRRMLVSAGVMWGAVATWMALGYVLLIIGMSRAWR